MPPTPDKVWLDFRLTNSEPMSSVLPTPTNHCPPSYLIFFSTTSRPATNIQPTLKNLADSNFFPQTITQQSSTSNVINMSSQPSSERCSRGTKLHIRIHNPPEPLGRYYFSQRLEPFFAQRDKIGFALNNPPVETTAWEDIPEGDREE